MLVISTKKNEAGKGEKKVYLCKYGVCGWIQFYLGVVREGFIERTVTYQPEVGEQTSQTDIEGESIPGRDFDMGTFLGCLKHSEGNPVPLSQAREARVIGSEVREGIIWHLDLWILTFILIKMGESLKGFEERSIIVWFVFS